MQVSVIRESAVLQIRAISGMSQKQASELTETMEVSEIEALGVFLRWGMSLEDCIRLAKIAGDRDNAFTLTRILC
jgi:hypothetical protein